MERFYELAVTGIFAWNSTRGEFVGAALGSRRLGCSDNTPIRGGREVASVVMSSRASQDFHFEAVALTRTAFGVRQDVRGQLFPDAIHTQAFKRGYIPEFPGRNPPAVMIHNFF
jgi:hypothetical protein